MAQKTVNDSSLNDMDKIFDLFVVIIYYLKCFKMIFNEYRDIENDGDDGTLWR